MGEAAEVQRRIIGREALECCPYCGAEECACDGPEDLSEDGDTPTAEWDRVRDLYMAPNPAPGGVVGQIVKALDEAAEERGCSGDGDG